MRPEYQAGTAHRSAAKATDENLTSENWEYIMVGSDASPEASIPDAGRMCATAQLRTIQGTLSGEAGRADTR